MHIPVTPLGLPKLLQVRTLGNGGIDLEEWKLNRQWNCLHDQLISEEVEIDQSPDQKSLWSERIYICDNCGKQIDGLG